MSGSDRFGFSVLSRRRWLRLVLGAGVAVAGGAGMVRGLRGPVPASPDLWVLSPREHATFAALARAVFPTAGSIPAGADQLDLAHAFDRFLADEPPWNQADLRKALLLLELGPLLFEHRLTTFPRLAPEAALRHFEDVWARGPSLLRRQVALAFRKFLALVYFDSEAVWPSIGYPGPSFGATVSPPVPEASR
ncbi:MAG: hypothetical protein IPK07_28880 [Deltaproteobacteria bacterium]|nr:hypothetical protein [Deltaproteobacteria bacterium]